MLDNTKRLFTVVAESDCIIQCIGITQNFDEALGIAFYHASEIASDHGYGEEYKISSLQDLEGETGVAIEVQYGKKLQYTDTIYVLFADPEQESRSDTNQTPDVQPDPEWGVDDP